MNTRDAARFMRRVPTPAEARLWAALRRDQLGGFHFRRQEPVGKFVADFFCKAAKLAVEVDGPVHDTPDRVAYDRERDAALLAENVRVLRVTNAEVLTDLRPVLARILAACREATIEV